MEWPQQLAATTAEVSDLLRAAPADLRLARVRWSAAETGAHLVSLPARYWRMTEAPQPFPASLSADNARTLVPERDPRVLADLLDAEVADLLDALADAPRVWYFTTEHTAAGLAAIMLTELLMHGLDLAKALGQPWPITRTQATACVQGLLPALPLLADPAAVDAARGTYHLHVRGSDDWTIRITDTVSVAPGRPPRADVHFSADPLTFLLTSYGHLSPARALFGGGMIAWGRRPWLATRFGRTFRET